MAFDGFFQPGDRLVHVFHQERVVQGGQAGAEEGPRLLERFDPTLDQQGRQHGIDSDFRTEPGDRFRLPDLLDQPFPFL